MSATAIAVPLSADPSRYQARFWRSPFAVATAALLLGQSALMVFVALVGARFPYEVATSLTTVSAIMLAAGLWPNWNYVRVDGDGIDQQAGLRSLRFSWNEVDAVRCGEGWVRLRVGRREHTVFNRYGMSADEFAQLIERAWLRARR